MFSHPDEELDSTGDIALTRLKLSDLIAAAGLVTLFGQHDLEIAWMTV